MEQKLTPSQALREYFLHRRTELKKLRGDLYIIRDGSPRSRLAYLSDIITHIVFLRDFTSFIIDNKSLARPTDAELATLKHDLRIFEAIHTEATQREEH